MKNKYFNNAGCGIMSEKTISLMVNHFNLESQFGGYVAAKEMSPYLNQFYSLSAKLLNAKDGHEIAFIDSASRGWNMVMYGLPLTENNTIITLSSEYGTNLLTIYDIVFKNKCRLKIIDCDDKGHFIMSDLEDALHSPNPILAISHVAAQGSIINPIVEIGKLAKNHGAYYIVDGCQAVGQIDVDVQEIGCDAYITAGRKWLRGPRGTGILYVRSGGVIRTPQIDLASADLVFDSTNSVIGIKIRDDAKQFELWERSIASVIGLTNAISECLEIGLSSISEQVLIKSQMIRDCILSNSKFTYVGDPNSPCGISSFYVNDKGIEEYVKTLFEKNNYSISLMCDWDCPLFFPKNGTNYIYRISPHYYTSMEDINCLCDLISKI